MTTKSVKTVLKGILSQLGLTKNEVLVYLANLELGSAPASKLAKVAGLNRVTAYEALQRLSKQGLVSIHVKKGTSVKYFQVESIDSVQEKLEQTRLMAEERLHQLDEQKDALREAEDILANAKTEAGRMAEHGKERLEQALTRREKQAVDRIAQVEAQAIEEVRHMAVDIAMDATRELVAAQVDAKGDAIVDAAIGNLASKLH